MKLIEIYEALKRDFKMPEHPRLRDERHIRGDQELVSWRLYDRWPSPTHSGYCRDEDAEDMMLGHANRHYKLEELSFEGILIHLKLNSCWDADTEARMKELMEIFKEHPDRWRPNWYYNELGDMITAVPRKGSEATCSHEGRY